VTRASHPGSAAGWRGALRLSPGRALYVGPAGDTRPHRHHALQLVVALEGAFTVQVGRFDRDCRAMLVGADTEHRIDGGGLPLAIYYVDGSCEEGRIFSEWLGEEGVREVASRVSELREAVAATLTKPAAAGLSSLSRRISEALECPPSTSHIADPAITAATQRLEESLGSPLSVPELARSLGIRQRELSARFRRETGLPIRRYVLWLRLKATVAVLAERRTLTEAAHEAGFSDAAHLSRTFVEMFGVAPSESLSSTEIEVSE
jgi:AraC-like DNA-binding protein